MGRAERTTGAPRQGHGRICKRRAHGESLAGDQHSFVLLCNLDLLSVYCMSGPMLAEDTEVGTESPALLELTSLVRGGVGGGEEGAAAI